MAPQRLDRHNTVLVMEGPKRGGIRQARRTILEQQVIELTWPLASFPQGVSRGCRPSEQI